MHTLMQTSEKKGEEFIKNALAQYSLYQEYKAAEKYKTAYKLIALTENPGDYISHMKKYLYYAAKRPITPENLVQTNTYFDHVGNYFNFQR
jgi:hypothetical protein